MEYSAHYVRNILENHRKSFGISARQYERCTAATDSDEGSGESASLSPHSSVYSSLTTQSVYFAAREVVEDLPPRHVTSTREPDRESLDSPSDRSPLYDHQPNTYDDLSSRATTSHHQRAKGPDCMSPIRQGLDYKRFLADKKLYHCHQCKYVTDRKNNLKRHVVTMHEKCTKLLECCELVFPNKAALREHVISCHKNGYNCRVCGRSFCRKALLKRHITVHSGQKDYICNICGYATSHKSNLDRHRRRHEQKAALPAHLTLPGTVPAVAPYPDQPYKPSLCENTCFSMFMDMEERWKETFNELHKLSALYTGVKHKYRSSRYMFPKRLMFTHVTPPQTPTKEITKSINGIDDQSYTKHKDAIEEVQYKGMEAEAHAFSQAPLPVRYRWRLAEKRSLRPSSRRLVPCLYRCQLCDVVFKTQLYLSEHSASCTAGTLAPPPQRPLTIVARKQETTSAYRAAVV